MFLFEIFEKKDAKWAQRQNKIKMQKLQRIKQRWVNDMIKYPDLWEDDER